MSKAESVTQPGASWNAQLGDERGLLEVVSQFVPSGQVPTGAQVAGPGMKDERQPAGRAGGVVISKLSRKNLTTHGPGVGVVGGVGVGVPVAVAVGVALGVGKGVGEGGGGPSGITKIGLLVPVMDGSLVSVTVIVWYPYSLSVGMNVPIPLGNGESGGR